MLTISKQVKVFGAGVIIPHATNYKEYNVNVFNPPFSQSVSDSILYELILYINNIWYHMIV